MRSLATLVLCTGLVWLAAGMANGGALEMGRYYDSASRPLIQAPTWKAPDLTDKARAQQAAAKEIKGSDPSVRAHRNVEKRVMPVEDRTSFRPYPLTYPRRYRPDMEQFAGSETYPRTSESHIANSPTLLHTMQGPMGRLGVMEQPGVMERYGTPSADYLR